MTFPIVQPPPRRARLLASRHPWSTRSGLAFALGTLLATSSACDRGESGKTEAGKTEAGKAAEGSNAAADKPTEATPPPVTEDQRTLWRSTCAEVMASDLGQPPPPPPPPPPPADPGQAPTKTNHEPAPPVGTATMPKIPPAPKRYAVVPRPFRSRLPEALGLKEGSCDPAPWLSLHEQHPEEESLYCAVAFVLEECGQLEEAMAWTERRARDFPKSADAHLAIAVRHFAPLNPDPQSGMPYNEAVPPLERIAIADRVVADLDAALALHPEGHLAHSFGSMTLTQRAMAWEQDADPTTPQGQLRTVLARKDLMAAHAHVRAIGEAEGLSECTMESRGPCIPGPPLTEEEVRADAELEARLLGRE